MFFKKIAYLDKVFACYSMISIADMNEVYAEHARPGGWNGTVIISAKDYCFKF